MGFFFKVSSEQYFSIFLKVEHYQLRFLLQVTENPTQWTDLKDREIITLCVKTADVKNEF